MELRLRFAEFVSVIAWASSGREKGEIFIIHILENTEPVHVELNALALFVHLVNARRM